MSLDPSELGAFLSGAAAIISAFLGSRIARKRAEADCEQRIKEIREALHEGYEMKISEKERGA